MQMQFDLDYVGHSATLSFASDDMHYAAVFTIRNTAGYCGAALCY